MRSSTLSPRTRGLSLLLLSAVSTFHQVTQVQADLITDLRAGIVYAGKTSGVRFLSLLGETQNKLIATSYTSIDHCPEKYRLGDNCITFILDKDGQLDDMKDHPGATPRQRNFVASPDIEKDKAITVSFTMMLEEASAQPGFFHLAQIIGDSGPSWTMSIFERDEGSIVGIVDPSGPGTRDEHMCDKMLLEDFMAGPVLVVINLDVSLQRMRFTVRSSVTKRVVLSCVRNGDANLSSGTSVQGGAYRRVIDGSTKSATTHIGGFRVQTAGRRERASRRSSIAL